MEMARRFHVLMVPTAMVRSRLAQNLIRPALPATSVSTADAAILEEILNPIRAKWLRIGAASILVLDEPCLTVRARL
jgi:hypothetical protein